MNNRPELPDTAPFRAVFFDFGGVVMSSPFDDLNRYEREHGLPHDFIRRVNSQNPNDNAWAKIERGEITAKQFDIMFGDESEALGHRVPGRALVGLLEGQVRPAMVETIDFLKSLGYAVACLTNSTGTDRRPEILDVKARFHHVIDSSKVGIRKPEPEFFERSCALVGVAATQVVFLDDLGINLKPARAMGMTTIKVLSEAQGLADLSAILQLKLPSV